MVILICGQPMIPNFNFYNLFLIRLGKLLSLIFFAFFLSGSCKQNNADEIRIIWKDSQAVSISVPKSYLTNMSEDSIRMFFQVSLENQPGVSMLGETGFAKDQLLFTPLIPFSRGLAYEINYNGRQIGKIKIPSATGNIAPVLLSIYPTQDTLPENVLKLYLEFSRPMRENESLKHILLINQNDTIQDVFLDLRPELWNEERTVLTIWLDPGRIKRDLIPNQQMGNPLKSGERYTILVSSNWKDVQGLPLTQAYKREFMVGPRDSISPDIERWTLNLPPAQTNQPLVINTHESLDFFLLQETIHIIDATGNKVSGTLKIGNEESQLTFTPNNEWLAGKYTLTIAPHLEDLAGNNLNKVFDRDITVKQTKTEKTKYERSFALTTEAR